MPLGLKHRSDIPTYAIKDIYDRLSDIFGKDDVVIIGGRAVNIYCFNSKRDTHDVDVVVSKKPSEIEDFDVKALEMGMIPRTQGSEIVGVNDNYSGAQIDFFYKDNVGGVERSDILETALERTLTKEGTVRVVHPGYLVLIKYTAGRDKDWDDIRNIMRNMYNSSPAKFFKEEEGKIRKYIPDQEQLQLFAKELTNAMQVTGRLRSAFRN
ncbi:MAG: nucleotidyltransferase [Candidatus Micrarchaeota archaeon]|nr:nucleotidyltransferase [Candidatus Micrarchaeota archaeon]